jgi:hypothetical protein
LLPEGVCKALSVDNMRVVCLTPTIRVNPDMRVEMGRYERITPKLKFLIYETHVSFDYYGIGLENTDIPSISFFEESALRMNAAKISTIFKDYIRLKISLSTKKVIKKLNLNVRRYADSTPLLSLSCFKFNPSNQKLKMLKRNPIRTFCQTLMNSTIDN